MAIEELKEAYERAEKLSSKNQSMLAKDILAKITAMEWDEKWDETLASPESVAYQERVRAKIEDDIATGNVKNYFTDDDLEKLF